MVPIRTHVAMYRAPIKVVPVHFKMIYSLWKMCSLRLKTLVAWLQKEVKVTLRSSAMGGGVSVAGDVHEEEHTILEEEDVILEEDNDERSDQPVPTESRDELDGEY